MKFSVFWDITTCRLLKVNRLSEEHFVSIFGINQARNKNEAVKKSNEKNILVTFS
jgi:hypothetical protein